MAREVLKNSFKVGDKIRIRPEKVTNYSDWKVHKGDIGTIKSINYDLTLKFNITWPDGNTSAANAEDMNLIVGDWDA